MLIAQLSDPHVAVDRPGKIKTLHEAVAHVLALPMRPDVVLVSGDCTDTGTPEEYALLREALAPLTMPVYVLPGNHDRRDEMLNVFGEQGVQGLPGFVQFVVEAGPLRLLALDTHVPGAAGGELDGVRLNWLDERLREAPDSPTLIVMHHPPLLTGLKVMDSIGLAGTAALRDVVARHPQVERLLAGHTHMSAVQRFAGTVVMCAPALEHALLPDLTQPDRLIVQQQPPAYLLHHYRPDTGLTTFTSTVTDAPWETLHTGQRWVG